MLISLCLCQKNHFRLRKIMQRVSLLKLPGSLNQDKVISLNTLQSDLQVKQLCTPLMPNGSKVTEIFQLNSINGPTSSDGNLSIQLPLSELDNFFGKKGILLMQLSKKLRRKCLIIYTSTVRYTQSYSLFQCVKVSRLIHKNSQEVIELQQWKPGFPRMEEQFSLQLHITQDKTSPKCLRQSLRMKRKRRNMCGRQVGDLRLDQQEL